MKKRIKYEYVNLFVICLFTFLVVLHFKKINQSYKPVNNTNNFLEVEEESADIISVEEEILKEPMYGLLNVNNNTMETLLSQSNAKEDEIQVEEEIEEVTEVETETEVEVQLNYVDMDTPSNNSFKAYMGYQYITDRTSNQWSLQQQAYTDQFTGIRMIGDRCCIAVGSYYTTTIGTYIDLIMENGNVIKCILGDCKSDMHTDAETHRYNPNGCIAEFIVDESITIPLLTGAWGNTGDLSDLADRFKGEIKYIRVYN